MAKGVYLALATKIETAWQAAWSQFVDAKIISHSGNSSSSSRTSSSSTSSISSVSSQASSAAFDPEDPLNLYDNDLHGEWIDELPAPPSTLSFLDPEQSEALLKAFRDQLRLTIDNVGGNSLDLPKAKAKAAVIYAELVFRQLHMLTQFIQAE